MSYTSNPFAGVAIAFRCAVVKRGTKNPLSFAGGTKSRIALASGVSVPMPTLFVCENAFMQMNAMPDVIKTFFIGVDFKNLLKRQTIRKETELLSDREIILLRYLEMQKQKRRSKFRNAFIYF